MKKLSLMAVAVAVCALLTGQVVAQTDKISISLVPQPNQITRLTLTYEGDIDITLEGEVPESLAAMKTTKMNLKSTMGIVRKNGPLDSLGQLATEITYDQVNFEITLNGTPLPADEGMKKIVGKSIIIISDSKGEIVDVKAPADLGVPTDTFKQALQLIYGNMPKGMMSVGETISAPLNMDLPIPLPGAGQLKFNGEVKSKLVAVTNEADNRIARFDQTTEAKLVTAVEIDADPGKLTMNLDLKLGGGGTAQINVSKNLLKSSETKMTIDGKISTSSPTTDVKIPNMIFKGTMKVSVSATN